MPKSLNQRHYFWTTSARLLKCCSISGLIPIEGAANDTWATVGVAFDDEVFVGAEQLLDFILQSSAGRRRGDLQPLPADARPDGQRDLLVRFGGRQRHGR